MMRRRFRSFRRGMRRPSQWVIGPWENTFTNVGAAGGVASTVLVAANAASTAQVPNIARMTILRIRGTIQCLGEQAANTPQFYYAGICVVDAAAAGTTVLDPSSATDADAPWLWLDQRMLIGAAIAAQTWNAAYLSVDVRVKRVLRPNERLMLFENVPGLVTVGVTRCFRTLISKVA